MGAMWLIAEDENDLLASAKVIENDIPVNALVLGDGALAQAAASIADSVAWIDVGNEPTENYSALIADILTAANPSAVVGVATPAVRAAVGKAACSLSAAVVSGVISAFVSEGEMRVSRTVFEEFLEKDTVKAPAFLLVSPLSCCDAQVSPSATSSDRIKRVDAAQSSSEPFLEVVEVKEVPRSQVEDAEYVIDVGFGVRTRETFDKVHELAGVMGAEIGASMNFVEHTDLMPGGRHIGISGMRVSPKLCLALGVSGSPQHRVGIRGARVVAVVNNDPKAKMFSHADYGIVGDVNEVVPALTRALS